MFRKNIKKAASILISLALSLTGLTGIGSVAYANEPEPVILTAAAEGTGADRLETNYTSVSKG